SPARLTRVRAAGAAPPVERHCTSATANLILGPGLLPDQSPESSRCKIPGEAVPNRPELCARAAGRFAGRFHPAPAQLVSPNVDVGRQLINPIGKALSHEDLPGV